MRPWMIVAVLSLPGLLLPAGVEFRMCFCGGGDAGGCCHASDAPPSRGCCKTPRHVRQVRESRGGPTACKTARCSGCVKLAIPRADPAKASGPNQTAVPACAATPVSEPPADLKTQDVALAATPHPPPLRRNLPLLI